MACDNFSTKKNKPNKSEKISTNVYFDDVSEKSSKKN